MNMAIDSKGDIWFTENDRGANKIAQLVISSVPEIPAAHIHAHSEENKVHTEEMQESAVGGKVPLWVYISGILLIVVVISVLVFMKKKAV